MAQQTEANHRVLVEMSQRKKTEESLRKAQDDLARISRITTMGQLAATIAHEVNQPLAARARARREAYRVLISDLTIQQINRLEGLLEARANYGGPGWYG